MVKVSSKEGGEFRPRPEHQKTLQDLAPIFKAAQRPAWRFVPSLSGGIITHTAQKHKQVLIATVSDSIPIY